MGGRIAAIILAAGYSSRMGEFKPLLTLGGSTVLERVVTLFHDVGIGDVRVVVGHRSEELVPLVRSLDARPLVNERFSEGMFTSVVAGVDSIEKGIDAFFLLPVDIPLVRKFTVEAILREFVGNYSRILYPCFCGKRGHPPLIPGSHRKGILGWRGDGGLKTYLSCHDDESVCVEVADETILADMDTPEDYRRLHAMWERLEIPTVAECEALLRIVANGGERLLAHGRAVSRLACFFTEQLNRAGCILDPDMVAAAGMLHDLAKGQKSHASVGADILRRMGYPAVADIVDSHMKITIKDDNTIGENQIVYLADKMMSGDRIVTLEERFRSRLVSSAADPVVHEAVKDRLRNAQSITKRVEKVLGRPIDLVLNDFRA